MSTYAPFLNKTLIVGITRIARDGTVVAQFQLHGRIRSIDPEDGLTLEMSDGDRLFQLPPDVNALHPASPGTFRERSTGESIENPDFISMWQIHESEDPSELPTWRPGPQVRFSQSDAPSQDPERKRVA